MTVKEDSGIVLEYIYNCKIEGNEMPNPEQLLNVTKWNNVRLNNALQHLSENEFIDAHISKGLGSTKVVKVYINDITALGTNIIEHEPEFKNHFGITVNLGLIQINWGKQES